LLDFAGGEDRAHGRWGRLVNSHALLKDNSEQLILQQMRSAGFVNAEKVKDGRMLFGLLPTAYYEARNGR
jgi:hypothetical protein